MTVIELLQNISFGDRIAEEESSELARYFVETEQWKRIFSGDIDIVYGSKGSGKSAIYTVLMQKEDGLFDRGILLSPAENPRGTPSFKDLTTDPPTSEREFIGLWKFYILQIIADQLREYGIDDNNSRQVISALEEANLLQPKSTFRAKIRSALNYVRSLLRIESVEAGMEFAPTTGIPSGFKGKITLREPSFARRALGYISTDDLFKHVQETLENKNLNAWVAIDRLDVAFAENAELEKNALRALFKVYLDLLEYPRIGIKIFLRDDIQKRITREGFREASHITRHTTILWSPQSLLNLIIRRVLKNQSLVDHYNITPDSILGDSAKQKSLFYRIFPNQVEVGEKRPDTFDWMLGRVKDGTGIVAPRELIHLLSVARERQIKEFEVGSVTISGDNLFSRNSIKDSLYEVSKVRLEQTLLAEYPQFSEYITRLEGQKTEHKPETLDDLWGINLEETTKIAFELAEVGFFELRGTRIEPTFWIPFLYRPALKMIRGKAWQSGDTDQDD